MGFIWHPLLPFAKHQQIKPGPKTQIVPQKSRKTRGGNTGAGERGWSKELWPLERKTFVEEQSWNNFLRRLSPQRNPPTANLQLLLVPTAVYQIKEGRGIRALRPYRLSTTHCYRRRSFRPLFTFETAGGVPFLLNSVKSPLV